MSQQTLFSRLGGLFKKGNRVDGELPIDTSHTQNMIEPRSSFLRPWAKRDAAISHLQDGFNTLTDLMGGIKQNLEQQGRRHEEMMGFISQLPQVMQSLPENSRVQGETLKAIHQQLAAQNMQQEKLSDILDKMSDNGTDQRGMIEQLRERVESFREQDQQIVEHMQSVGAAMQKVSHTSSTSASVLENLRDGLGQRDAQLERVLNRQNTRFTTMLAIAIFLSVAALVAVSIIGYLLIIRK